MLEATRLKTPTIEDTTIVSTTPRIVWGEGVDRATAYELVSEDLAGVAISRTFRPKGKGLKPSTYICFREGVLQDYRIPKMTARIVGSGENPVIEIITNATSQELYEKVSKLLEK